MSNRESQGFWFLLWLIIIEACWILGTKVSEMLLDYIIELRFEEIQIAESIFSYTIALTIFGWGYLVDRYNSRRKEILMFSSAIWIIGSIVLFLSPVDFGLYITIQIIWGLSFGASGPLIASYLGDLFHIENRGKLFSIFTIFIYIIKGFNIAINGLIGELIGNWKAPTFIFGIVGIFIVISFYFIANEPQIAQNEPEFQQFESFSYSYHLELDEVKSIVKKRTNLLFLLQGISGMIGVVIVTKYMNYWFTSSQFDGLNINTGIAILLLGSGGALGGLIGILLVGRWIDYQFKHGRIQKIILFSLVALFVQVIFYAILILGLNYPSSVDQNIIRLDLFLQMYPVFIGFIIIFNLCVFCGTPVGTTVGVARTHINLPEHRGTAGALFDLTDFIGSGAGILVGTTIILALNSFRLTIMVGSFFWIISGIIWIFIAQNIKQDYEKTREILQKRASLEH